ncbi:MAG: hypothetical protein ACKOXB_07905 [Flavobacteriales bacterium]
MRKKHIILSIICLIASIKLSAQDSVYLAISAKWHTTYSVGINEHVNITNDKNGAIYVATHQEQGNGKIAVVGRLDQKGGFVWKNAVQLKGKKEGYSIVYATAITLDNKGNLIVFGRIRNQCLFTSTDSASEVLFTPEQKEHAFVAKYNPDGKLLWVKTVISGGDEFLIGSASVDRKGNIYFSGTQIIKIRKQNEILNDPSILAGKLDASGNQIWIKKINGEGRDMAVGSAIDKKGNYYLAGVFEKRIQIEKDSLQSRGSKNNSFLASFTPDGNLTWTLQPEQKSGCNIQTIAIDAKDRLYFAGEFWDTLRFENHSKYIVSKKTKNIFVASCNKNGEISWLQKITDKWHTTEYVGLKQMKVGRDGFLYLSGCAYEMSVTLANNEVQGFKQLYGKDGKALEGFVLKYDLKGNALWLRIVSGNYDQIISDIVINENSDITISGNFTVHLDFKNNRNTSKNNVFFAHSTAADLASTSVDKAEFERIQEEVRRKSINHTTCSCEEYTIPPSINFYSLPLTSLVGKDALQKETRFFMSDSILSQLIAKNIQPSGGAPHEKFYSIDLAAYTPIQFKPSANAIGINLTPCELKEGKFTVIHTAFTSYHPIKNTFPEFDENSFKGTGKEYFDIAYTLSSLKANGILNNFIGEGDDHEVLDFIKRLNKKYKLKLDYYAEDIEEQIARSGKDIDLAAEIYNFYLKPLEGKADTLPNDFLNRFSRMFYYSGQTYSVEEIKDMIHPQCWATLQVKRFKIEFSPKLINSESPWAMYKVDQLKWSNREGIHFKETEIEDFCMAPFSIGNTGIKVGINKAYPDLSVAVNILKKNNQYLSERMPYGKYQMLNIPTQFTGIYAWETDIEIPFEKEILHAKGFDFFISNNEITGFIRLSPSTSFSSDNFIKHLSGLGFVNVKKIEDKDFWVFSFSYRGV